MSAFLPLHIFYEDTDIIVCEKPAGVASESTESDTLPSMPALLCSMWNNPQAYVGVVHRLDVGVSGVMVFAKTPAAAAALSRQITQSQEAYAVLDGRTEAPTPKSKSKRPATPTAPCFIKTYRAVIAGAPDEALPQQGTLRDLLFKDSRKGRVFAVDRPRKGVREAVLAYEVIATAELSTTDGSSEAFSLIRIVLHTGRTHQIRAQFSSRRHPLWGDGKYGSRKKGAIALQSARLQFKHPRTGAEMDFAAEMPKGEAWEIFHEI
jgi:23S rRNA pseudouridine1911/1915/1917 synthase